MSLSLFDMPKLPGTAKLLKNDDFCVVHFNQTILCRSRNKSFVGVWDFCHWVFLSCPSLWGRQNGQKLTNYVFRQRYKKNDDFEKFLWIKLHCAEVKIIILLSYNFCHWVFFICLSLLGRQNCQIFTTFVEFIWIKSIL